MYVRVRRKNWFVEEEKRFKDLKHERKKMKSTDFNKKSKKHKMEKLRGRGKIGEGERKRKKEASP